jgi:FPC/CPF motif-containing protein YcgG
MSISHAERRQIENEMIFRRINEKVGNDLDALDVLHEQEGNPELMRDQDLELDFKCECSDENCTTRIAVPLTEYQTIHENRDTFIVMPNHQVDPIEKIFKSTPTYSVVVKNHSTAEPSDELNTTTIDNS